jgi:LuxR family transcriptional regulator, maltose regulon positive regulatory protein
MGNEALRTGQEALARGAWDEAYASFRAALRGEETAEVLEGLGMAAWWLDDAALTFDARERAYRLYRQAGDYCGAARIAIYLGYDYYSFRGDYAIANGWFQRAHRLLEAVEMAPEQGLLAVYEGYLALMLHNDIPTARKLGAEAARIGRTLGILDLEMLALALEGLALVSSGEIVAGMRCLDESTTAAVSGEITDLDAQAQVCCYLIFACERVRDYDRAAQWCAYMEEITTRWKYPMMFSYCRMHYAGVLIWRGHWVQAEATLLAATKDLIATRPVEAAEGIVRLADLRRLQGRFDEAATLLNQAESHPFRMVGGHLSQIVRAALAIDQGDTAAAVAMAERFLRSTPAEDRTERPAALELLILAQIARGDRDQAKLALAELESIVTTVATEPLRAAVSFALGIIAAAGGEHETACHHFEDAIDLFRRCGAPFETARARFELARSLLALGQKQNAGLQAHKALETLRQLGAMPEAARVTALIGQIESVHYVPNGMTEAIDEKAIRYVGVDDLTPRELEVLHLIAAGRSNQEIAAELVLSVRTVERHISNIYQKLHISGPAARATATAYLLRLTG